MFVYMNGKKNNGPLANQFLFKKICLCYISKIVLAMKLVTVLKVLRKIICYSQHLQLRNFTLKNSFLFFFFL